MSLLQVKEVLPQLNSRSQLGRVMVNPAFGLDGELTVRPSEAVLICCGRAYLSMECLETHQKEGNCTKVAANTGNMPPPPPPPPRRDQDPLADCISGLDDGRDNESFPIINCVGSLRAEDIDDIDIFEEEPRALIDNSRSSSNLRRPSRGMSEEEAFPGLRHRYEGNDDGEERDPEDSWLDEDEEDGDEIEYDNQPSNEWDELEEVEVYEGSDMIYGPESHPNLHVEASYSEAGDPSDAQGSNRREENEGKFKCNFPSCIYSTVTEKNLRIHLQNAHDPSSTHICGSCVCRYKSKSELTRHMQMFHGHYGPVQTVPEIIRVAINGKLKFRCKACGYTCRSQHPLKIHVHSAHVPNGRFRCSYCVCQYAKGNQLTQHVLMYHKDKLPIQQQQQQRMATPSPPPVNKLQPTTSASANYLSRKGVEIATTTVPTKNSIVQLIKLQLMNGSVVEIKKVTTHDGTKYECKMCPYSTPKRSTMIGHARGAHVDHANYACPHCPCRYNSSQPFHAHLRRAHPDKPMIKMVSNSPRKPTKPATPKQSSPSFGSETIGSPDSDLHVPPAPSDSYKLVMINRKALFKCEACGFMARDLSHTNRHIYKSHGPAARYYCKDCTFRFSHHSSLALHLTRIHPESIDRIEETEDPGMELLIADGIKIFRCKLCLYVIPIEGKCLSHVQNSHRPDGQFQCDMCSCRFMQPGSLGTHKALFHRDLEAVDNGQPETSSSSQNAAATMAAPPPKSPEAAKKVYPGASTSSLTKSPIKAKRSPNRGFVRFTTKLVNAKRWFICSGCQYSTMKEKAIKAHVIAAHNPTNRFKCRFCSCRYAHKGRLSFHVSTSHKRDLAMPVLSPKAPIPSSHNSPSSGAKLSFKCDKCPYSTTDKTLSDSHKDLHLPSNKYPCNVCSCRFPSNDMLLQHLTVDHDNAGSTTSINPTTSIVNFVGYKKIIRDGHISYKCTHAGCVFVVESSTHIRHHVGSAHDPERSFCCKYCSCRFGSEGRLNKHMREYHDVEIDTPISANPIPSTASSSQTNVCKTEAVTRAEEDKAGIPFAGIAVLKCQISGCGFETQPQYEAILENHMKSAHSPKAKFKCEQCPCRYNNKTALTQHVNSSHGHINPKAAAEDATKETEQNGQESESNNDDLTNSPGGKLFQCKFCEFSTRNKGGFVTHLTASHSAKNPYQCKQCCCRFATAGGLTCHEYKSHNKTSKKKPSRITGPTLKTHKGLLQRMTQNSKATAGSITQALHRPKPIVFKHSCAVCLSSFNNPSSLNWHMIRVHTNRNPDKPTFSCDKCGYQYDTEMGVVLHMRKSHRKNSTSGPRIVDREATPTSEDALRTDSIAKPDLDSNSPDGTPSNSLKSRGAIAKAARKYAEIEGPDDLPSDSEGDENPSEEQTTDAAEEPQPTAKVSPVKAASSKRQCSKCSYSGDSYLVVQHEQRAHVENGHQCSYCVCSYKSLSSLRQHMSLTHTKKERGSSNKNNVANHLHNTRSSSTSAPVPEEGSTTTRLESDENDAVSSTNENDTDLPISSTSSKTVTVSTVTTHKCPLCTFTCRLPINLRIHELSAHVKGGYVCKYCSCSYRTTFGLDSHLKLRHKKHISVGHAMTTPSGPSTSVKVEHETGEFESEDDDTVTDNSTPNRQELVSSGLLRCSKCSFSTKLNINLSAHMKSAHTGNHQCDRCNRSFTTQEILNKHNLDVHKSASPDLQEQDINPDLSLVKEEFVCPDCPFTTSLRMKLKQHEKKHKTNLLESDEVPAQVDLVEDTETGLVGAISDHEEVLDENSRKRKKSEVSEDTFPNDILQPKAKQRRVLGRSEPATILRTKTRRSAEVARKVISSVIQSEQLTDADAEEIDNAIGERHENDGANGEPRKKKARAGRSTSESVDNSSRTRTISNEGEIAVDHDAGVGIETNPSDKAITEEEGTPRTITKSKKRHSLKEVATLQRATERIARNARHSKESSKRAAGLREFKKFTCSRCAMSFDAVMKLTSHYQRCEEKLQEFQCSLCDNKYVSLLKLKEHIWKTHMLPEDKQKSEAVTSTTKSPLGHPYTCSLCKLGLKELKSYILHMSVPHLFRCKKCVFVCGTKTAMDRHKNAEHRKRPALPDQSQQDNDEILVVYDSAAPAGLFDKAPEPSNSTGVPLEKPGTSDGQLTSDSQNDTNTLKDNDENLDDMNVIMEEPEQEIGESLICVECGYLSETLEEAREHSEAAMNIESLICSICGQMATSGCDSVLHIKSHQDDEDGSEFVSVKQDENHDFTMKDETHEMGASGYEIEFEFKDGSPLENSGMDTVEVPFVTENDPALDPNPVILFELKDLESI